MKGNGKIKILLFTVLLCFAAIIGGILGSLYEPGMILWTLLSKAERWMNGEGRLKLQGATLKGALVTTFLAFVVWMVYVTNKKNYLFGKEYGTSKLLDPRVADQRLRDKIPGNNRFLSAHLALSLNSRKTRLNNNVLAVGGSGAGKTLFLIKPNLLLCDTCSFVVTDPKGENLLNCAGVLKERGYVIKVLNLVEMEKSDGYNPFAYIRDENDIIKLVTNLISNTTPPESKSSEPFWEKAEAMLLQALFLFTYEEFPMKKRNFNTVMYLLSLAEANEDGKKSELDKIFDGLAKRSEMGRLHPAVKTYDACMKGAPDTVRSIIISVRARLSYLMNNPKIQRILEKDEMEIESLGIGRNGDGVTKTALFCVIPDSDKSYSFIVGALYTQIFQELYYHADFCHRGRLPIPVTFLLDEFANVPLPNDFCSLVSTMRSREISVVIILQNMAQIKAMYKDTWETIPGNCVRTEVASAI